jgi:hypothetical protein
LWQEAKRRVEMFLAFVVLHPHKGEIIRYKKVKRRNVF